MKRRLFPDALHDSQHIVRAVHHVGINQLHVFLYRQAAGFLTPLGQFHQQRVRNFTQTEPGGHRTADLSELQGERVAQCVRVLVNISVHQERIDHAQGRAGRHLRFERNILQPHGLGLLHHNLNDLERFFYRLVELR